MQPWKTKTCHGRKFWRMILRFKDICRHIKRIRLMFLEEKKEIFIRRLFSEFLWILLSSVLTRAWCKRLMWWANYYSIFETVWKGIIDKFQLFQPGGEKAIKIVESKRKELAALMKASLPPCDRMGLICRFSHCTQEHTGSARRVYKWIILTSELFCLKETGRCCCNSLKA